MRLADRYRSGVWFGRQRSAPPNRIRTLRAARSTQSITDQDLGSSWLGSNLYSMTGGRPREGRSSGRREAMCEGTEEIPDSSLAEIVGSSGSK